MKKLEAHPVAELFPLMGEEELEALAEDIKTNGLRQPIVLIDGKIGDGRNRYRACQLADVEPTVVDANGADPLALVVSLNVKRRNLTTGQRAIAAAEAWEMAEKEGRVIRGRPEKSVTLTDFIRDPREYFARMFGAGTSSVRDARTLVVEAPDLASSVKAGALLSETMTTYKARQEELRKNAEARGKEAKERERLAAENADLHEEVEAGRRTLSSALGIASQRAAERALEEERAQSNRILASNLAKAVDLLQMDTDDEKVADDVGRFDRDQLPDRWSLEAVERAATYLVKFSERLRNE